MRRVIPLVAILLALFTGAATADIGLVADIDGDYTNGPDTLLADPGDTIQVNIWITGDDSLVAFGITFGNTTGALQWIEQPESLVYTTPSGWADIPVPQDSLGWLMIQSTDFSHSIPLVLPSKVAEMNFVVAPGDSCGTIVFDLEISGWQDWGLNEGEFSQLSTVTVCAGMIGGRASGGGDEANESSESDTPPSYTGPTSFSRLLTVPSEDVLFIHGQRKVGDLSCSWSLGGPLTIDGLEILPGEPEFLSSLADEELPVEFGQVPMVRRATDVGEPWRDAIRRWEYRKTALATRVACAYGRQYRGTRSDDLARAAAQSKLDAVNDTLLVEESASLIWRAGKLYFPWRGFAISRQVGILIKFLEEWNDSTPPSPSPPMPSYTRAVDLIQSLQLFLEIPGYSLVIVPGNADIQCFSGGSMDYEEFLSTYLAQIQDSRPGDLRQGRISETALAEIVEAGGLYQ